MVVLSGRVRLLCKNQQLDKIDKVAAENSTMVFDILHKNKILLYEKFQSNPNAKCNLKRDKKLLLMT